MNSPLRSSLGPLLIAIAVLVLTTGCGRGGDAPTAATTDVEVVAANPIKKQIVEWDEYTGRFDAIDFVEVRSRVGGYLESIHFTEGQVVEQGDLLFVVDQRPYLVAVKQAEAAVREARARENESKAALVEAQATQKEAAAQLVLEERRYRRAEQLVPTNAISQEEFDERSSDLVAAQSRVESANAAVASAEAAIAAALAAIATAESALDAAQLNLEYTKIYAPINGRASRRDVTVGNLISGGSANSTLLTTIVSQDPIHCYFDADEYQFLKYARLAAEGKRGSSRDVKNPVYVQLADERPAFPHYGHMDFVDNRLDPNTGTMRGRAILRNSDHLLTPGLFARIRLPGSGTYEAVLIPDMAILSDQAERYVYVVDADGTVERQGVKLGPRSHGLRVIHDGLNGNETIITRGLQRVRPGVKVKAQLEELKLSNDEGLPDEYQPVPETEWISRDPANSQPASSAPPRPQVEGRGEGARPNANLPPSSQTAPQPASQ